MSLNVWVCGLVKKWIRIKIWYSGEFCRFSYEFPMILAEFLLDGSGSTSHVSIWAGLCHFNGVRIRLYIYGVEITRFNQLNKRYLCVQWSYLVRKEEMTCKDSGWRFGHWYVGWSPSISLTLRIEQEEKSVNYLKTKKMYHL